MSLFSALSVSASGMAAQRTRAELLVENMANAETTRTPTAARIAARMHCSKLPMWGHHSRICSTWKPMPNRAA